MRGEDWEDCVGLARLSGQRELGRCAREGAVKEEEEEEAAALLHKGRVHDVVGLAGGLPSRSPPPPSPLPRLPLPAPRVSTQ